jgi:hypothetical protein
MPSVPATLETEARESLESRSLRLALTTWGDLTKNLVNCKIQNSFVFLYISSKLSAKEINLIFNNIVNNKIFRNKLNPVGERSEC